jgi:uncharacterized membrane protein
MNENVKKILIGVIAVIAVVFLAFQVMNFVNADKPQVIGSGSVVPPGFKNEKEKALEAQQGGAATPDAAKSQEERESALAGPSGPTAPAGGQ